MSRQIYQTKTVHFQNTKITQLSKIVYKQIKVKGTSFKPFERSVNEENLLSLCRKALKFLNKALLYSWLHFDCKMWNKCNAGVSKSMLFYKNVVLEYIAKIIMNKMFSKRMKSSDWSFVILQIIQCIFYTWASRITLYVFIIIEIKIEIEPRLLQDGKHVVESVKKRL